MVLGILTRTSLESKYVLLELGAAWAFEKIAIPLLAPGVSFEDLPGPFKDVHAVEATNLGGVLSVLQAIERHCSMPMRSDAARQNAKATEFVARVRSIASAQLPDAEPNPSPPAPPPATSAEDIPDEAVKMKLVLWLEAQEQTPVARNSPVELVQIARQASVSVGAVERLIGDPEVLGDRWELTKRAGGFIRLERGPGRVRDVRGPRR